MIAADPRADLAAEYERLIGYDPIADDPNITAEEIRQTIAEWHEAAAQAE